MKLLSSEEIHLMIFLVLLLFIFSCQTLTHLRRKHLEWSYVEAPLTAVNHILMLKLIDL